MGAEITICVTCDQCGLKRQRKFKGDIDILDDNRYAADFGFDVISDENKSYVLCSQKCLRLLAKAKAWDLSGPWIG